MCSRTEAVPAREPGGCSHACLKELGVPQPCHRAYLALSRRSTPANPQEQGQAALSPHFPILLTPAGGREHYSLLQAELCAVPGWRQIPFPVPGRRESYAAPDPRHRLCVGVGAAQAPARSQRPPWHQRRELLFKTVFSIRAQHADCAFIVGGLLLRPGD